MHTTGSVYNNEYNNNIHISLLWDNMCNVFTKNTGNWHITTVYMLKKSTISNKTLANFTDYTHRLTTLTTF